MTDDMIPRKSESLKWVGGIFVGGSALMALFGAIQASYYALETGQHWIIRLPLYMSVALGAIGAWLLGDSIRVRLPLILGALFFCGSGAHYFTSYTQYKVGPGPRWAEACLEDVRALNCGRGSRGAMDYCVMERMDFEKHASERAACVRQLERLTAKSGVRPGPLWTDACQEHARRIRCKAEDCLPEDSRPRETAKTISDVCQEFMNRTSPYRGLKPGEVPYLSGNQVVEL